MLRTALLLALLLASCAAPAPPPPVATPAPTRTQAPDVTPAAVAEFRRQLATADPNGALVSEVQVGGNGAIALRMTDAYRNLPLTNRESTAADLHRIWRNAYVAQGGNEALAMTFFYDRQNNSLGRANSSGVNLK